MSRGVFTEAYNLRLVTRNLQTLSSLGDLIVNACYGGVGLGDACESASTLTIIRQPALD